jgi:hypothetical protein
VSGIYDGVIFVHSCTSAALRHYLSPTAISLAHALDADLSHGGMDGSLPWVANLMAV